MNAVKRMLDIRTAAEKKSVLLLGPRQTGKSTLLRDLFPESPYYNLLFTDVFFRLQQEPARLRHEILALEDFTGPIIIDEIQKLPILLDEVQSHIDSNGFTFVLTGSSARKLKAGGSNLLGGRPVSKIHPFVSAELADFRLSGLSNGVASPGMVF